MGILFDTDAFCKLGAAGLLEAAAEVFGAKLEDCARLAALPYMLKRGKLRTKYGDVLCDALLKAAERMQVVAPASSAALEVLRDIQDVDPGEAQLLAVAADRGDFLLTGDKRALRAVRALRDLASRLEGKIVVLEVVLLELCATKGEAFVQSSCAPTAHLDTMMMVCFSPGNPDPAAALRSYVADSQQTLEGLTLWPGTR